MRLRSEEAGFSVVEVIAAALVLALSALAVMSLVDTASRNNYRAQQSQTVNDRLQQEMETLKRLPYAQVALTSLPNHSDDASDPNNRVSGSSFNVNRSGAASNWSLVYNGGHSSETGGTVSGGTIDPGPTPFQSGDVKGKIYRYVVWQPQTDCANCAHGDASDTYDGHQASWFKHIVVAITLDESASGGARTYQEVQGDVGNPDAGLGSGSGGGTSNNNETPWTFWLTDTPCENDTRQPISSDHLTHNTLGVCSSGLKSGPPLADGGNTGAPDLMFTRAAPCASGDCSQETLYDYATDVEPAQGGGQDVGLQEMAPPNALSGGGCLTDITGVTSLLTLGPDPEWYVHKWVSPLIPSDWSDIKLSGSGALNLWTQTIGGSSYSGRLCVWLFTRHLSSSGVATDTLALSTASSDACSANRGITAGLPYFPCSNTNWPSGTWTELHIPLAFNELTIPAGDRLGVAIAVERQGTAGSGLQFMYDAPTYDSHLEVNTKSTLPF